MIRHRFWLLSLIAIGLVPRDARCQQRPASPLAASPASLLDQFTTTWDDAVWGGRPRKEGGGYMLPDDCTGWKQRMRALQALVVAEPDAVDTLLRGLESPHAPTRVLAAQALSLRAAPRARPRLLEALAKDPEPAVRLYAADALGTIADPTVVEQLKALQATEKNKDVQRHIAYAVERQGKPMAASITRTLRRWNPDRIDTARIGQAAPDFELASVGGTTYRLSDFRGKQAVVLVFIYGDT